MSFEHISLFDFFWTLGTELVKESHSRSLTMLCRVYPQFARIFCKTFNDHDSGVSEGGRDCWKYPKRLNPLERCHNSQINPLIYLCQFWAAWLLILQCQSCRIIKLPIPKGQTKLAYFIFSWKSSKKSRILFT